jgi:tetratricopeptide (TPR) repeat protein
MPENEIPSPRMGEDTNKPTQSLEHAGRTLLNTHLAEYEEAQEAQEAHRVYDKVVARICEQFPAFLQLGSGLEQAVQHWQTIIVHSPDDAQQMPDYLDQLGDCLSECYALAGLLADLDAAIHAYARAVSLTAPDSPSASVYLISLGTCLQNHYDHTGQLSDLEEAINVLRRATISLSADAPNLPIALNNLSSGLLDRYTHTGHSLQ